MAIPVLRQQNDWVCGVKKWPLLIVDVQYCIMLTQWVGGSKKVYKYVHVPKTKFSIRVALVQMEGHGLETNLD